MQGGALVLKKTTRWDCFYLLHLQVPEWCMVMEVLAGVLTWAAEEL